MFYPLEVIFVIFKRGAAPRANVSAQDDGYYDNNDNYSNNDNSNTIITIILIINITIHDDADNYYDEPSSVNINFIFSSHYKLTPYGTMGCIAIVLMAVVGHLPFARILFLILQVSHWVYSSFTFGWTWASDYLMGNWAPFHYGR